MQTISFICNTKVKNSTTIELIQKLLGQFLNLNSNGSKKYQSWTYSRFQLNHPQYRAYAFPFPLYANKSTCVQHVSYILELDFFQMQAHSSVSFFCLLFSFVATNIQCHALTIFIVRAIFYQIRDIEINTGESRLKKCFITNLF